MKNSKNSLKGGNNEMSKDTFKKGKHSEKSQSTAPMKGMKSPEMHKSLSHSEPHLLPFGNAGHHMVQPDASGNYGNGSKDAPHGQHSATHGHSLKDGYMSAHMPETDEVGKGMKE